MKPDYSVYRHVLGGGPGGGKTTGLSKEADFAKSLGWNVIFVQESATLLLDSGLSRGRHFQADIIEYQFKQEDFFNKRAARISHETKQNTLIIHDRSMLDGLAYMEDKKEFEKLLALHADGLTIPGLFHRYNVVTHLVTAADGALEFYTNENNLNRTETPQQALERCLKLRPIWTGHDHYKVITNRRPDGTQKSFDEKINENSTFVFESLGHPSPIENERRWSVKNNWDLDTFKKAGVLAYPCDYTQTYLVPEKDWTEERVRMKTYHDGTVYYFHTFKKKITGGKSVEEDPMIDHRKYSKCLSRRDQKRNTIHKTRYSFVWKDQVFTLDDYRSPNLDYSKLEIEGAHSGILQVDLPDFLPIIEEVTDKEQYRDKEVALLG